MEIFGHLNVLKNITIEKADFISIDIPERNECKNPVCCEDVQRRAK